MFLALLFAVILTSCNGVPFEPQQPLSVIIADVHWGNQGVAGVTIVLVQTSDTVRTASNGLAIFSVPAGNYTIRAFGINRGGPVLESIDFGVATSEGDIAVVDIVDCQLCD